SVSGVEQQGRNLPAAISFGRIPPAWFISTSPLTSPDLQVPHIPSEQEEGTGSPAWWAASRTVVPGSQTTVRPLALKSMACPAPARCVEARASRAAGAVAETDASA